MSKKFVDYYALLGVARTATNGEIKTARRRKLLDGHVDKNPDSPKALEFTKNLNRAKAVLLDSLERSAYDTIWVCHHASLAAPTPQPRPPRAKAPPQRRSAPPPTGGSGWGLFAMFATAAVVGGVAYATANANNYDRNAQRYRGRDGTFRGGRFG